MMAMSDIKLVALDLDGTLLTSEKVLTPRTQAALEAAASRGIEIVPATGRFYLNIPETLRNRPFLHYAITMNGAQVYDVLNQKTIYASEIQIEDALAVLSYLDTLPVIYDCYADGWGYMSAGMQERAEDYISKVYPLRAIKTMRTPVPDLKAFLSERFHAVQKIQLYTKDVALWNDLLHIIPEQFPQFSISSSLTNNIEINSKQADKGIALLALAKHLKLDPRQIMAFGDGMNDLQMLRVAGIGVAMGNAHPDVKSAADHIALDCDSDGVADMLYHALIPQTSCGK